MRLKYSLPFLICCFLLVGNTVGQQRREVVPSAVEDSLGGRLATNVYTNSRLGFSFTVPAGWTILTQETIASSLEVGADLIKSKNAKSNEFIDEGLNAEKVLLSTSRLPIGAPANAIITVTVRDQPDPRATSKMVIDASIHAFIANPNVRVAGPVKSETIGGRAFASVELVTYISGVLMRSRIYNSTRNKQSLTFVCASFGGDDNGTFDEVLRSLKFFR